LNKKKEKDKRQRLRRRGKELQKKKLRGRLSRTESQQLRKLNS